MKLFKNTPYSCLFSVNLKVFPIKESKMGAGEVEQWLWILAAIVEDPGSIPSIYTGQIIPAYNSCSRGFDALFWLSSTAHACGTYTDNKAHKCRHKWKYIKKF